LQGKALLDTYPEAPAVKAIQGLASTIFA
jgi:Flp pilus assembly CpaE family ATPase